MLLHPVAFERRHPWRQPLPLTGQAKEGIITILSMINNYNHCFSSLRDKENVTRYQLAMITAKMIANVEQMGGNGSVSKTDLQTLEKLTVEFADELALLGVKVTALEDDMQVVKEDVAGLKKDVDGIKSYMKNGGMDKVKLSGDMLVRNYGATYERDDLKEKQHRTETLLRLQLDAQIDENVTARARWNMIENSHQTWNGSRGAQAGIHEWDGQNKNTGDVEVAYIQIKDMFSFGGDFKFGRDWYQHGHGLVVHNYMDAINYTKRCGDVDIAFNVFFDRNNDLTGNGRDSYNVWNINADYSTKGHDLYLGIYYNEFGMNPDNEKKTVIEFGSSGKLSNNNEKVKYDLGLVHSDLKEADQSGFLGHVAVKYDDQKQLKAKLAYTFADDEYFGGISTENMNRFHDGDNSVYEDLALLGMANGFGTNFSLNNMSDIKLELDYTLKDNDKHNFRLAYDYLQNDKNNVDNTGSLMVEDIGGIYGYNVPNGMYAEDTKVNVITFEYTYKLAENTRLRLGYQNGKFEAKNQIDMKTNLYYTELFSKF